MKNFLIHLLNYERWANRCIIDALETLETPPDRAVALMGHILAAQQIWAGRAEQEPTFISVWEEIPLGWMAETTERQHRKLVSYVASLSETDLLQTVAYTTTKGVSYQSTLLDILTHLSHHAAYHRGQITQLIRPLLPDSPVTDFIVWTRE